MAGDVQVRITGDDGVVLELRGARVLVVDAIKPYLKTDKNGTEADNLGNLPTY